MSVEIDVEYCATGGYQKKFKELSDEVLEKYPDVKLLGHEGRSASFEVKLNGTLIHSKLATLAFPDYKDVTDIVREVSEGQENPRISKQQPITDCIVS